METIITSVMLLVVGLLSLWQTSANRRHFRYVEVLAERVEVQARLIEAQTIRINSHETRLDEITTSQHNHTKYAHNGAAARFSR